MLGVSAACNMAFLLQEMQPAGTYFVRDCHTEASKILGQWVGQEVLQIIYEQRDIDCIVADPIKAGIVQQWAAAVAHRIAHNAIHLHTVKLVCASPGPCYRLLMAVHYSAYLTCSDMMSKTASRRDMCSCRHICLKGLQGAAK